MNSKKIFSIVLFIAGEVLLIICFLYFGRNIESKLLTLNIIVSSIIYALFFIDILFPMVDFKDKSQKTVGSFGLIWVSRFWYMLFAIGVMIIFNTVKPIDINSQIIIHIVLFFLMTLGLYFAYSSTQKVQGVFYEENLTRGRLDEMIKALKEVQIKLKQTEKIPEDLHIRMNTLQSDLRFISPCNNREAIELESNFIIEIKAVLNCLFDVPFNLDEIIKHVQNCEKIYQERKQIFSN